MWIIDWCKSRPLFHSTSSPAMEPSMPERMHLIWDGFERFQRSTDSHKSLAWCWTASTWLIGAYDHATSIISIAPVEIWLC
ncbi:hypothetical protein P154DRAFT_524557 [Amniculicola lignicola CBS 123094]|uniref:Uncharacterized protein n=1 Tax=Amniculicola lignicola CBS 123094 TaxID=1392246 RepID=A0A6A5W7C5_9PLEO|nr:hypothetical protein P154DRAFT_524557 [Amniculicola lignicola CBS 123094]